MLDELIRKKELDHIIKACSCMSFHEREAVGKRVVTFAQKTLQSDTLTLLSIGSSALKQELIVAEKLMRSGYHVKFILLEPTYYAQTFYPQLEYDRLKRGFDAVAADFFRLYQKKCEIIATFPSAYFYFNALLKALDVSMQHELLMPSMEEFASRLDNIFFIHKKNTDSMQWKEDGVLQDWCKIKSTHSLLFIATAKEIFLACVLPDEVTQKKVLWYRPISFDSACVGLEALKEYCANLPLNELHLFEPQAGQIELIECVLQLCDVLEKWMAKKTIERLKEKLPEIDKNRISDLLPHLFMIVDSNNPEIETLMNNMRSFFKKALEKEGLLFQPSVLHYERIHKAVKIKPLYSRSKDDPAEAQALQIPAPLLFSELSKKIKGQVKFPQAAIQHIIEYVGPKREGPT